MFSWRLTVSVCLVGLALSACHAEEITKITEIIETTETTTEPSTLEAVEDTIEEWFSDDDEDEDGEWFSGDDEDEDEEQDENDYTLKQLESEYDNLKDLLSDIQTTYDETEADCNGLSAMLQKVTVDDSNSYKRLLYRSEICNLNLKLIELDMEDVTADMAEES